MQIQVRSCNVTYDRRVDVLVSEVHITEAFDPSSPPNPPKLTKFLAIWDTGATNTVITQKVINACGLKPIGMTKVNTASDEGIVTKVYFASIWLPNKVCIPQLRVTEGVIAGDAEVLIGMDIISQGDFAVTNWNGKN